MGVSSANGLASEQRPDGGDEEIGIVAPGDQGHAARIVDVGVEDAFDAGFLQFGGQSMRVEHAAERQQLHEETAVGDLGLSLARSALFTKIEFVHKL